MKTTLLTTGLAALCFALLPATARSALILPTAAQAPNGYRLLFVTDGATAATSSDVATYNAFVNTQAEVPGSLVGGLNVGGWKAVVTTPFVDLRTNTGLSLTDRTPIYLVSETALTLMVEFGSDLWNPDFNLPLLNAPNLTQFGAPANAGVWTGTDGFTTNLDWSLGGSSPFGGPFQGGSSSTSRVGIGGWLLGPAPLPGMPPPTDLKPLYAVSEVLASPNPVPEPGTALVGVLLLGVATARRRRA